MAVLLLAQNYIDSACSKTCNVGDEVTYEDFKQVYVDAWKGGAKGCTTFRLSGKRFGVLHTVEEKEKNTQKEFKQNRKNTEEKRCLQYQINLTALE